MLSAGVRMLQPIDGRSSDRLPERDIAAPVLMRTTVPQLLVSVRRADEVDLATAAGCSVLDIKDPLRGSLGCAAPETWRTVVSRQMARARELPHEPQPALSVALGELTEWLTGAAVPVVPAGVQFAKLGLAGMMSQPDTDANPQSWGKQWLRIRQQFDLAAGRELKWVAVCYADGERVAAPSPEAVLAAARNTGCVGMLLDTCDKHRGRLMELWSPGRLAEWTRDVQQAGLFAAVAGSLTTDDLPGLRHVGCDLVGIRGAACEGGGRTQALSAAALGRFCTALRELNAFSQPESHPA